MKNLILTLVFTFLGLGLISAQSNINIGLKSSIGIMNSKSSVSNVTKGSDIVTHEINYVGSTPVISLGGFAQAKIGYLWVSTELLYTQYDMNYSVKSFLAHDRFNEAQEIKEKHQYVDIPVVAGLHSNNFRVGVGPVVHLLYKLDSDFKQFDFYNEKTRSLTFGFLGTIGYDLNHVHFDLSYENVFRSLGSHINYGYKNSRFKGSPGHLKLTVGYSF